MVEVSDAYLAAVEDYAEAWGRFCKEAADCSDSDSWRLLLPVFRCLVEKHGDPNKESTN